MLNKVNLWGYFLKRVLLYFILFAFVLSDISVVKLINSWTFDFTILPIALGFWTICFNMNLSMAIGVFLLMFFDIHLDAFLGFHGVIFLSAMILFFLFDQKGKDTHDFKRSFNYQENHATKLGKLLLFGLIYNTLRQVLMIFYLKYNYGLFYFIKNILLAIIFIPLVYAILCLINNLGKFKKT